MSDLFEKQQWYGKFFMNKEHRESFSGEVNYSPRSGLVFSYLITDQKNPDETTIIHGVFPTGRRCTLLGAFAFQKSIPISENNLHAHRNEIGFPYLVIGEWLENDELFYNVDFSLTGMQNFFLLERRSKFIKYPKELLLAMDTEYGQIKIGNISTDHLLDKDISSQIHSKDTDALTKLRQVFKDLEEEYPNTRFWLKENAGYGIRLNIKAGANLDLIYKHINDIANLFSVLTYVPVYPDSIHISKNKGNSYSVYRTTFLSERIIELARQDMSHFDMPITQPKINLATIIQKWLYSSANYTTIISSIQSNTGYHSEHLVHGELLLYVSQFESISSDNDKHDTSYLTLF